MQASRMCGAEVFFSIPTTGNWTTPSTKTLKESLFGLEAPGSPDERFPVRSRASPLAAAP
jgi:hypothetical protein